MAKKSINKKDNLPMEEVLWKACDVLLGSIEPSEYKHVVLSLIFLKYAGFHFEKRRQEIIADGLDDFVDNVEFYAAKNVFYLPETARWSYLKVNSKQPNIASIVDKALSDIEKENKPLHGALPNNYYSSWVIEAEKLGSLLDKIDSLDSILESADGNDIIGRVYEYFLSKFAIKEGKGKGEFYTPKTIVNLIAEMIEPYEGKIYDPCCGSGHTEAYTDVPEFCKSVSVDEEGGIADKSFSLVLSKYIEFVNRDEVVDYDTRMKELQGKRTNILRKEAESRKAVLNVFKSLGYEIKNQL